MSSENTCDAARKSGKKLALTVLAISIALHAALAAVAGIWIVVKRFSVPRETPPPLVAKAAPTLPPKERKQAMEAAAMAGASAGNLFKDHILSVQAAKVALPETPILPVVVDSYTAPDSISQSFLADATALSGEAGAGAGTGARGGTGGGTGVSFLGVQTNAKRIVLMFDISKTVAGAAARTGMPMQSIREETARLIEGLGVNTRFGLVEFARNYAFFRSELVPSSNNNRAAAIQWLNTYFATEGTLPRGIPNLVSGSPGFLVALEAVFKLQPDSIFVISDANLQRGTGTFSTISMVEVEQTLSRLQAVNPTRAKIFFIGVGVQPETEKALKRVLALAGGGGTYSALRPPNERGAPQPTQLRAF
jgi:hypothetical protein